MTTEAPKLDPISHIAGRVSFRWFHSDAIDWVTYAWALLADAGVVPQHFDELHPNYTDHVVTAAALAYLSDSFEDCEQPDGDVDPPDVSELITDIELGRHAERVKVHATELPETGHELAAEVVRDRMPSVAKALAREIGQSRLFADLWAQRLADLDGYPIDDDRLDEIVNVATTEKTIAWEWLDRIVGRVS